MRKIAGVALLLLSGIHAEAGARGVSPYLPLDLDPELERQIARVLVLANRAMLTRPIAAATVLDALPAACLVDAELCLEVRRALRVYMHDAGLAHASIETATGDDAGKTVPNRHGLTADGAWQASVAAFWQPSDNVLLTLGAVADEENTVPTGSVLSLGWNRAQLDIGYRGHWLSPMSDSSMLLSSQAPTMPSVTLSNYTPLTRFGLRYEVFLARMSRSDSIAFGDTFTVGHPRLAGLHLSMEPASGWALGVSRLLQYGGGDRGGQSFSELLRALFRPSRFDNTSADVSADEEFGNQVAAITSQFVFPTRVPFTVYFEYAGEDTSRGQDYLLGNTALSAGIRFPNVTHGIDLTFETSEWQNGWYVNDIYRDGLRHRGHVIGHWGGDERVQGDAVGAHSHMLRMGWKPPFGGWGELTLRTLQNEDYSPVGYERAYDVSARYSRTLGPLRVGGEVFAGRDAFGEDFSWVGAFVRYAARDPETRSRPEAIAAADDSSAHIFVEAGINASKVSLDRADDVPRIFGSAEVAPHFAIGARRAVSNRSDLGARIEIDDVDGSLLIAVRAIDYRYRFSSPLAFTFFVGAARYDVETPAYGIYYGIGAQWRDVLPGWDVGMDVKLADKVARDHLLLSDPVGGRNDTFYDIESATLSISRRF